VSEHRPVERLPEERRAVAVRREVLVGVDAEVLNADEPQPIAARRVQQDLRAERIQARPEQRRLDVVVAHAPGR
jgi:hypothetical protein